MRKGTLLALLAVVTAACGDNLRPPGSVDASIVDAAGPDAEMPDAYFCEARPTGEIGGTCTDVDGCGASSFCLNGREDNTVYPEDGYCLTTNFMETFCDSDADCGDGNVCATIEFPGDLTVSACLPSCCMFDSCPTDQACFDTFNGSPMDKRACVPGNAAAVDGDDCAGVYSCNESSQCTNDFEHPGGSCETFSCTVGDDSTCHGGTCIVNTEAPPFNNNICVDECEDDSDCREVEGYVCHDDDALDPTNPKYCRHPHVGDPCTTDDDCGGGSWVCKTGGSFVGGYCTQEGCANHGSGVGCTAGSICGNSSPQNICFDRCPTIGTTTGCRLGYTCDSFGGFGACRPI